jgi:hypothetical protein
MEAQGVPEPNERDTTDEWRIAAARSPTSVAELEGRIDVALAIARSAEEAALEIGAASLEAAKQARRAAALAERASASAARAADSAREASVQAIRPSPSPPESVSAPPRPEPSRHELPIAPASNGAAPRRPDPFEERLTAFRLRAEKVMIRLQKLELGAPPHEATEVVRLR